MARSRSLLGALVVAAVALTGVVVVAASDPASEPASAAHAPSRRPRPIPAPPPPFHGTVAVDVVSPALAFRLTANLGCTECSTVWVRRHGGAWTRLHDFQADPQRLPRDLSLGPVTHLAMTRDGRNGWAWGDLLYSTHDGGVLWDEVGQEPGRRTDHDHLLVLTGHDAWSLLRVGDERPVLYRSPLGTDAWVATGAPELDQAVDLGAVGGHVVLQVADSSRAGSHLRVLATGARLAFPCHGDVLPVLTGPALFALCRTGRPGALYRSRDLRTWQLLGHARLHPGTTSVVPLRCGRALVIGPHGAGRLLPGRRRVALGGLPAGYGSAGRRSYVVVLDGLTATGRLLSSTDGIRWRAG